MDNNKEKTLKDIFKLISILNEEVNVIKYTLVLKKGRKLKLKKINGTYKLKVYELFEMVFTEDGKFIKTDHQTFLKKSEMEKIFKEKASMYKKNSERYINKNDIKVFSKVLENVKYNIYLTNTRKYFN